MATQPQRPQQRRAAQAAPAEEFVFASAGKRAVEHKDSGSNQCLRLPTGMSYFPVKAGTYMLDFFPYKVKFGNTHADPGTWAYERTYWQHGGIGGGQFGQKHCCLVQNWSEKCPVCVHLRTLGAKNKSERTPQENDMLQKQSAKERQIFCVALADDPKRTKMIMEHSFHLFGKKLDSMIRNAMKVKGSTVGMYDTFYNPADGYTVRVTFEEKSIGQGKCVEATSIEMIKRAKPYPMSILNNVPCFDEMLVHPTYEELYKLYWINDIPPAAAGGEDVGVDYQPAEEYPVQEDVPVDDAGGYEDQPAEDVPVDEQAEQYDNPEELPAEDTQYEEVSEEPVEELPPEELPAEDAAPEEVQPDQPTEDVTCGFVAGNRVVYEVKGQQLAGKIKSIDPESGVATIQEDGNARPRYLDCWQLAAEPEKPKATPKPTAPAAAPKPAARPASPATAKPATRPAAPQGRQPLPSNRPQPPKR